MVNWSKSECQLGCYLMTLCSKSQVVLRGLVYIDYSHLFPHSYSQTTSTQSLVVFCLMMLRCGRGDKTPATKRSPFQGLGSGSVARWRQGEEGVKGAMFRSLRTMASLLRS